MTEAPRPTARRAVWSPVLTATATAPAHEHEAVPGRRTELQARASRASRAPRAVRGAVVP